MSGWTKKTLLPFQVCCHRLGQPVSDDRLVYQESDESFYLSLAASRSEAYLLLELNSTLSSEVWTLPLAQSRRRGRAAFCRGEGGMVSAGSPGQTLLPEI